jgi:hypothetical protein
MRVTIRTEVTLSYLHVSESVPPVAEVTVSVNDSTLTETFPTDGEARARYLALCDVHGLRP